MKKNQIIIAPVCLLMTFAVFYYSCTKDVGQLPLCDRINSTYSAVILPMIQTNCAIPNCHNGSGYGPGNFNLYSALKIVADNGKLRDMVFTRQIMPPSGPLPDSLLQKLNCWLNKGAPND